MFSFHSDVLSTLQCFLRPGQIGCYTKSLSTSPAAHESTNRFLWQAVGWFWQLVWLQCCSQRPERSRGGEGAKASFEAMAAAAASQACARQFARRARMIRQALSVHVPGKPVGRYLDCSRTDVVGYFSFVHSLGIGCLVFSGR